MQRVDVLLKQIRSRNARLSEVQQIIRHVVNRDRGSRHIRPLHDLRGAVSVE